MTGWAHPATLAACLLSLAGCAGPRPRLEPHSARADREGERAGDPAALVEEVRRSLTASRAAGRGGGLESDLARGVTELERALAAGPEGEVIERYERAARAREGALEEYLLGRALDAVGRDEEAAGVFRSALAQDASFYPALEALALQDERTGRLRAAAAALESVLKLCPECHRARLSLARVLLRDGRNEKAVAALDGIPADRPESRDGALLRGQALAELGRFEESVRVLTDAAACRDDPVDAWYLLAGVHLARGEPEAAAAVYERIVELRPREARALFLLGRTYVTLDRSERAVVILERLLGVLPDDSGVDRGELRRLIDTLASAGGEGGGRGDEQGAGKLGARLRELVGRAGGASDAGARLEALRELARVVAPESPGFVEVLREALHDPDPRVRIVAVREIARRAGAAAAGDLAEVLAHADEAPPEVLGAVCEALGEIGERSVVPRLLPLLRRDDSYVFGTARRALARLTGRRFYDGIGDAPPPGEREAVARAWERWWEDEGRRTP